MTKKRKPIKIKTDKASTLFALVVSLGTLFIILYQTKLIGKQFELQRQQQYASVLPYLTIYNTSINSKYTFEVENNGIGPAFIEEINIHYKDTIYKNHDLRDFFNVVIRKEDSLFFKHNDIGHSNLSKGMLIPANSKRSTISMGSYYTKTEQNRMRYWLNNQIKTEIIYSSVYGEKWRIIYPSLNITPEKISEIVDGKR